MSLPSLREALRVLLVATAAYAWLWMLLWTCGAR